MLVVCVSAAAGKAETMSGIGGIAPREPDLSRRRDRQASVVLVVTAAITMFILFPLGVALGLIAMAYAHVSGGRGAFWAALVIVGVGLLAVILGLNTDFDSGLFRG
jgi:hypothetical protein